ncbi:MAG TPA: Mur ligase family protein, partial [Dehalococcoidia bacterium]
MVVTRDLGLRGKKVTVVGLGMEGVDLVRFLARHGAEITVNDAKPAHLLADRLAEIRDVPARLLLGGNDAAATAEAEVVFASQGVPQDVPALAAARARGVPIRSMTQLFLQLCPAPVAGITGSSGKTTTTSLVGAMFAAAGRRHVVGGNIGVPLLSLLDRITPET